MESIRCEEDIALVVNLEENMKMIYLNLSLKPFKNSSLELTHRKLRY